MREPFGTMVAVIVVVFSLFVVPLQYFANKQDAITQTYVYSLVTDFVNDVQLNGYISQDQYNKFMKELSNTNVSYSIEMTHAHDVISPKFNELGTAVKGTETITVTKYEDEILTDLFDTNGIYYFEKGDHFTLTVKNTTRTLAQKMNVLLIKSSSKYAILATYGATVRNENF